MLEREAEMVEGDCNKPAGDRRFRRVVLKDGRVSVNSESQASGAVASMANCNCLIEIRPDMAGAQAGETVTVYRF